MCLESCTNAVASPFGVTGAIQADVCRKLYIDIRTRLSLQPACFARTIQEFPEQVNFNCRPMPDTLMAGKLVTSNIASARNQ